MRGPEQETQYFTVNDFKCTDGSTLDLKIAYKVFGNKHDPAVLHPTCYGGKIDTTLGLIQDGMVLAKDYFVIVCALLGNGESSSPSNTPKPFDGPRFPKVLYEDNIRLQYALCQHLNVTKLKAIVGKNVFIRCSYYKLTL